MRYSLVCISVLALGCGDKESEPKTAPAQAEQSPVSSLWQLAPDTAFGGVVVPDGSIAKMRSAWLAAEEAVESLAGARDLVLNARRALALPIDLFDAELVEGAGLDLSKGVAVFFLPGEQTVIVLPVVDRAKFRQHTDGVRDVVDAIEIDDNKKLRGVCRMIRARYVCAKTRDTLLAFAPGNKLAEQVAQHETELRGDVELFIDVARSSQAQAVTEIAAPVLTKVSAVAASLTVDGGTVRARGAMLGTPGETFAKLVGAPAPLAEAARRASPSGMFRLQIPLLPGILPVPVPASAGVSWKEIASALTGELVVYTPSTGRPALVVELGATKTAPLAAGLEALCKQAPKQLPAALRWRNGVCAGTVDVSKLLVPGTAGLKGPFVLEARVIDSGLRLELTHEAITGSATVPPMSETGSEFLTGPWNFAVWGEAIGGALPSDSLLATGGQLPIGDPDSARALVWALAHIYELGFGVGLDADGLRAELRVVTFGSDPPDVLARFQRSVRAALQGDEVDIDLTEHDVSTLVGRQARIYTSGAYVVAGAAGLVAAVVIPAFAKYPQKAADGKLSPR